MKIKGFYHNDLYYIYKFIIIINRYHNYAKEFYSPLIAVGFDLCVILLDRSQNTIKNV